jgi:penicillin-binding protein 1B
LSKPDRAALQVAVVMSDPRTGEVLALLGDRDPAAQGFNRALRCAADLWVHLLKPLGLSARPRAAVALVAGEHGRGFAPPDVALPNGKRWRPDNSDGRSHGLVALQDALVLIPTTRRRSGLVWMSAWIA